MQQGKAVGIVQGARARKSGRKERFSRAPVHLQFDEYCSNQWLLLAQLVSSLLERDDRLAQVVASQHPHERLSLRSHWRQFHPSELLRPRTHVIESVRDVLGTLNFPRSDERRDLVKEAREISLAEDELDCGRARSVVVAGPREASTHAF